MLLQGPLANFHRDFQILYQSYDLQSYDRIRYLFFNDIYFRAIKNLDFLTFL